MAGNAHYSAAHFPREFRDNRTVFFMDYFDGAATLQYAMRVQVPGQFKVAPARAGGETSHPVDLDPEKDVLRSGAGDGRASEEIRSLDLDPTVVGQSGKRLTPSRCRYSARASGLRSQSHAAESSSPV